MSDFRKEYRYGVRESRWMLWAALPTLIVFGSVAYACSWFGEAAIVAREEFGPRGGLGKYEWFRDKHEAIVSTKVKVRSARAALAAFSESAGPRASWTFEDKQEFSRLSANVTGLEMILSDQVAEYNANSKKFNHETFRANDLPKEESTDA